MYQDVEPDLRWVQIAVVQGAVRDCGDVDFPGLYIRLDDPSIFNFIELYINASVETLLAEDYEGTLKLLNLCIMTIKNIDMGFHFSTEVFLKQGIVVSSRESHQIL